MSTLVLPLHSVERLSWPRIGALSGTLSLHFYAALLLLMPPVAMQLYRQAQEEPIVYRFIEPPPKPVELVEPVLPQPKHKQAPPAPHHETVKPAEQVVTTIQTPMSRPATNDGAAASTDIAADQDVAPTALGYGTRTSVKYPRDAAARGEHGTVILRVLVGTDGLPQQIEIETFQRFVAAGQCRGARCGAALDVPARHARRRRAKRLGARADRIRPAAAVRAPVMDAAAACGVRRCHRSGTWHRRAADPYTVRRFLPGDDPMLALSRPRLRDAVPASVAGRRLQPRAPPDPAGPRAPGAASTQFIGLAEEGRGQGDEYHVRYPELRGGVEGLNQRAAQLRGPAQPGVLGR